MTTLAMEHEPDTRTISAVVPAYGVEKYLRACLSSLLQLQSLCEVIVVIDASPDHSAHIAHQFARRDPRVIVIENPRNLGLGASRNVGLSAANGSYVIFVDSDDLVVPEALDAMARSLDASQSDFATAPADEFGRTSSRTRYWTTSEPIFRRGAVRTNLATHPELIQDHTAWTKLFRRDFLIERRLVWPEGVKCEDVALTAKAYALATAIDVIPMVSYLYRRRPGSITTTLAADGTVVDWATQTQAAIRSISPSIYPAAAQEQVRKILSLESKARLQALSLLETRQDRQAVIDCVHEAVARASFETLLMLSREVVALLVDLYQFEDDMPEHLARVRASLGLSSGADLPRNRSMIHPVGLPAPPVDGTQGRGPELSIVMPTSNVLPYVDEAIRSVCAQTYEDFELIVVDDASTDGTWDVLRRWPERDERVRIFRNVGVGGAQARNYGVQQARGTFLTFADGDDLVPAGAYAAMTAALRCHQSDMVIGDFQRFWPTSVWRGSARFGLDEYVASTELRGRPRLIANRTCWNRMFRADFWAKENLHFPTTPRANDILPMTSAMVRAKQITVIPDVVYHYRARTGGGSMTAALGTAHSLIGYLRQEALCASLVGAGGASLLRNSYWRTSLGADGWEHLGKFLKDNQQALDEDARADVVAAISDLWRLAPQDVRLELGARRHVCYELASRGHFQAAEVMWRSESPTDKRRNSENAVRALEALLLLTEPRAMTDAILTIFHDDVLRPLIDGKADKSTEVLQQIVRLSTQLHERVDLREAAVPETFEPRVMAAVLTGDLGLVSREVDTRGLHPPLKATLIQAEQDGLHVIPSGWEPDERLVRVEWLEFGGERREFRRIPVLPTRRGAVSSLEMTALDLAPLRGSRWRLLSVWRDELGEYSVPVAMTMHGAAGVRSCYRLKDAQLHVLHHGLERARSALKWRIKRYRARLAR